MKLNSIALLTVISMLNVTPTVVFAENSSNDAGPTASTSDKGTAPSMETSGKPTVETGSEMMPHQQQGAGTATEGSMTAPSNPDGGKAPATDAHDKGSTMGNSSNDGSSKSSSGSSY